jgi:hypothetical protein
LHAVCNGSVYFFQATKGDKTLGSGEIYEEMTEDAFSKYRDVVGRV